MKALVIQTPGFYGFTVKLLSDQAAKVAEENLKQHEARFQALGDVESLNWSFFDVVNDTIVFDTGGAQTEQALLDLIA